jgi:hypothetical protein
MTGKLQYVHINDPYTPKNEQQRFTVAIEIPSRDYLLDYVMDQFDEANKEMNLFMGIVRVHKRDNYCKSIGRQIAVERTGLIGFTFLGIKSYGPRHLHHFEAFIDLGDDSNPVKVMVVFSTVPHSEHVKVEGCTVE